MYVFIYKHHKVCVLPRLEPQKCVCPFLFVLGDEEGFLDLSARTITPPQIKLMQLE